MRFVSRSLAIEPQIDPRAWPAPSRPRRPRLAVLIALQLVAAAAGAEAGGPQSDEMVIPGGQATVATAIAMTAGDPATFAARLNRALLIEIDPGGRWERQRRRSALAFRSADLAPIEREFGSRIAIDTSAAEGRDRFARLAALLGYVATCGDDGCVVIEAPTPTELAPRLRQLAASLGWNLPALARHGAGAQAELELRTDRVPAPLPLATWNRWVGRPAADAITPDNAFDFLVRDQALGLLLEASRRLDTGTRDQFERLGLFTRLYRLAPAPFYRYASALRFDADGLVFPGGAAYVDTWRELVGAPVVHLQVFVPSLLTVRDGRVAALWHALIDAPPEVVRFYLGEPDDAKAVRRVGRLLDALAKNAGESFLAPYGGDSGMAALVRTLSVDVDGRLTLPGGSARWLAALRALDPATAPPPTGADPGDIDFLLAALGTQIEVGGLPRPALPRLLGSVRQFGDQSELLTPETVGLLARAVDLGPAAISPLLQLDSLEPDTVRDHLRVVAALDALPRSIDSERLILQYQAGTELTALLSGATGLPAAAREARLAAWSRLHSGVTSAAAVAEGQVAWLEELLIALPEPPSNSPGRGPLERALLAALAPARDPQRIRLDGVEFVGYAGRTARKQMARRLVEQRIPAYDDLVAVGRALRELAAASRAGDDAAAAAAANAAATAVARFPEVDAAAATSEAALQARCFPVDRPRLAAALASFQASAGDARLARRADEAQRLGGLLERELRAALLAPSYLAVLSRSDNPAFESPHLIRSHRLWDFDAPAVSQTAWVTARVERGANERLGASLLGAVAGIGPALAEYATQGGTGGGFQDLARLRAAFGEWLAADWEAIDPTLSAAVAAAIEQGDAVLAAATREPAAYRRVAAVVPTPRLERALAGEPCVALSERLQLGLDLLGSPGDIPAALRPLVVAEAAEAFARARAAHGERLQDRLDETGTASPRTNGRGRRHLTAWPPWEALERERDVGLLEERGRIDLKLVVVRELGRHGLDGALGIDLMRALLDEMRTVGAEGPRDWESWIEWTNGFDEGWVEAVLRRGLQAGRYELD